MKRILLTPTKEPHSDRTLKGYGYDDYEVMDLPYTPVFFDDGTQGILSVWKTSIWQRVKFLFDGRVNLVVMGVTQPACSISLNDYFKGDKP